MARSAYIIPQGVKLDFMIARLLIACLLLLTTLAASAAITDSKSTGRALPLETSQQSDARSLLASRDGLRQHQWDFIRRVLRGSSIGISSTPGDVAGYQSISGALGGARASNNVMRTARRTLQADAVPSTSEVPRRSLQLSPKGTDAAKPHSSIKMALADSAAGAPIESNLPESHPPVGAAEGEMIEYWQPRRDRYLLAQCFYGRLSNQEECMRTYLVFAALLNRTLLVSDPGFAHHLSLHYRFRWSLVFDLAHVRECLAPRYGNHTVVTVEELVAREGENVTVDHIACAQGRTCMDTIQMTLAKSPYLTLPPALEYPLAALPPSTHPSTAQVLAAYANYSQARVLSLGNLYGFGLNRPSYHLHQSVPPFVLSAWCGDLWSPPPVVRGFVDGFIDTFLGRDFAAVHMRRGDFSKTYLKPREGHQQDPAFLPLPMIARHIINRLAGKGVSVLYLATDAGPLEVQFLEKLLLELDPKYPVIIERLPIFQEDSVEWKEYGWIKEFQRLDEEDDGLLRALAEKHICASARYFIGTPMSTFSKDIFRIREVEGRKNGVDGYIGVP